MAKFLSIWSGAPLPVAMVTANSMSPSLMEGDIAAWTPTNMDDVEIGDVIVFTRYISWPDERFVVHRVSDIKTDSLTGRSMLETKGDANKWTDQKGPHIPEPYIREDHIVGKVISIGNQPLKIPLIGNLGVWIYQGLELLSQPTASKGLPTHLGIFAPLTASIVILAILIFVLPEKARTVKEKIKIYIFGHRSVGCKKTLISFLIIYVASLTIIHCFAYDSVSASVGIEDESAESAMNFGRIKPGMESFGKELPIINPGVVPVKGVIFGRGEINKYLTRETFVLMSREQGVSTLQAVIPNGAQNGSYAGEIMVYSSPFWIIYPDNFMQTLIDWNTETVVFYLDFLSALILTSITMSLLTLITFAAEKYTILTVDLSWHRASKLILKKGIIERTLLAKGKIKRLLNKHIGWIININLTEVAPKESSWQAITKPIIASLTVMPILFLIADQILAAILAIMIAGLIAYFIRCKLRRKIILTAVLVLSMAITYMIICTNLMLIENNYTILELATLELGVMGVYLLLLAALLTPLSFLSWLLIHLIRNFKEYKDPLLILDGGCNL